MEYIAVLITVHNRKVKTLKCLEYLFAQQDIDGYQIEIYLTDDGCTDGTREAIIQIYPKVNIVDGDGDLYWNRGMYRAWKEAANTKEYDFYLWLNDDTILNTNALYTLLKASKVSVHKAIIVGTTCSVQNEEEITYGGRNSNQALLVPTGVLEECSLFNGNIVLIPKHAYNIVGLNDPIFRHSLGDFDYGLRAAKKGVKIYIAPYVLGRCDEHENVPTWCNPNQPFSKRWNAFRTPLGQNPEEYFIFEKRHKGLGMAVFHYATNHFRLFFPEVWKIKTN